MALDAGAPAILGMMLIASYAVSPESPGGSSREAKSMGPRRRPKLGGGTSGGVRASLNGC